MFAEPIVTISNRGIYILKSYNLFHTLNPQHCSLPKYYLKKLKLATILGFAKSSGVVK